MSIERRFLGWHEPALTLAVAQLETEFRGERAWDMSSVVVALPGARAGRRLLELLAWRSGRPTDASGAVPLLPPRIVTIGALAEVLYQPVVPVAGDFDSLLARSHALRALAPAQREALFPLPPPESDILGWLNLAAEMETLDSELAGAQVSYDDVAARCADHGLAAAALRWGTLAQAQTGYQAALAAAGLLSRLEARRQAAVSGALYSTGDTVGADPTVVLIALIDIPAHTQRLLRQSPARVLALVHAPREASAGFDDLGCLQPGYWQNYAIPIEDADITVVDQPREQAAGVNEILGHLPDLRDGQITVALGDEALGLAVQRAVEEGGRVARRALARPLAQAPLGRLLTLFSAYAGGHRAADLAALLRHPDMAAWLSRGVPGTLPGRWPGLCDEFRAEHLSLTIDAGTRELAEPLRHAVHALDGLAPAAEEQTPAAWAEAVAALIVELHQSTSFDEAIPAQREVIEGFEILAKTLATFTTVADGHAYTPRLVLGEAVSLLLSRAEPQPLGEAGGEAPLEIVGWLEAHLDDASVLLVTGVNEGLLPQSVRADPLLPDSLRRELGLLDNGRRYARDAYWLSAIKHSRQMLALLASRHSAAGEPLAPSRLLFACDAATVARRALLHYTQARTQNAPRTVSTYGAAYTLANIPRPVPAPEPLQALSVTAFRDYIACPYRFYLKHICKLETVDDEAEEMSGVLFGNVAHRVLRSYGEWVINECEGDPSDDPGLIWHRLEGYFNRESARVLGAAPLPVVELQLRQLGRRLKQFAEYEAGQARDGWRIGHVEIDLERLVPCSRGSFRIHGRADRIDFHPDLGTRIVDYKTGDRGATPAQTHRAGRAPDAAWLDLQLPLYRLLARHAAVGDAQAQVGYIVLPQSVDEVALQLAEWSPAEFESAYATATDIIELISAQNFWPPSAEIARYSDGLDAICLDAYRERATVLAGPGTDAIWTPPARRREGAGHAQ